MYLGNVLGEKGDVCVGGENLAERDVLLHADDARLGKVYRAELSKGTGVFGCAVSANKYEQKSQTHVQTRINKSHHHQYQ